MLNPMDMKENLIEGSRAALTNVLKAVRGMPEDKLTWKPLDMGRSALEQLQEVAQSPLWAVGLLKTMKFEADPERYEKMRIEREGWTTVDECEKFAWQNAELMFEAIRCFPSDRLGEAVHLPFRGGMDMTAYQIMSLMIWNATYHEGQICYIQTLYGDKDMH